MKIENELAQMDKGVWRRIHHERAAIEERLKEELDAAHARHDRAKKEYHLVTVARDLGLDTADGLHALRKATQQYELASCHHREALKRFCDFVLHGKLPPST